jgi:hypothetical protein
MNLCKSISGPKFSLQSRSPNISHHFLSPHSGSKMHDSQGSFSDRFTTKKFGPNGECGDTATAPATMTALTGTGTTRTADQNPTAGGMSVRDRPGRAHPRAIPTPAQKSSISG